MKTVFLILLFFSVLTTVQAIPSDSSQVKAFNQKARALKKTNPDSAIYFYKQAIRVASTLHNKQWMYLTLKELGFLFFRMGMYDSTVVYWEQIIVELRNSGNKKRMTKIKIADAYSDIGLVYYYKGDYYKSLSYNNSSLSIRKAINDSLGMGTTYNKFGICYQKTNRFPEALKAYSKALAIFEKLNNEKLIAQMFTNIAVVQHNLYQYKKAEEYQLKALKLYNKLGKEKQKANLFLNMAMNYLDLKENEKVIPYLQKSLQIRLKNNDTLSAAGVYTNLAFAYQEFNQLDSSAYYLKKGYQIAKRYQLQGRLLDSYLGFARLANEQKDYETSIEWSQKAVATSQKIGDLGSLKDSYDNLRTSYEKLEQYKKALEMSNLYYVLKDSIFNIENTKTIQNIESKYETEKKNQQIEHLNFKTIQQNKEIQTKRQERNLWLGISILAIILGSISVYSFISKKKSSDRLAQKNKIIEKTLAEKDVLLREIHHRVKNNLQIISSLLNMQSRFLDDEKSKEVVAESQNRIKSMALIHQKLYQEENLTGIETKSYFTELVDSLCLSYGVSPEQTNIEIENLLLDVDTAIPLGLVLNEMISNAFKYGVNKEDGRFLFVFKQNSKDELLVRMKDNGPGIPKDFDIKKSKSYGMKLIQSLGKKLKAEVNFENNNGLEISMKIRKFRIA